MTRIVDIKRSARGVGVAGLTLAAAVAFALIFRILHLPLAFILGGLVGGALVTNLLGPMPGGRAMRRVSQLFVGASVGVLLDAEALRILADLFPLMLVIAVAGNLLGLLMVLPISALSGIDRVSGLLSCLPAGMAEMATLAQDLGADEQSVAVIHTLRIIIVLTLVPIWLLVTGHPIQTAVTVTETFSGQAISNLALLLGLSLFLAVIATRLRVINAYIVVPTLVSVALVAAGLRIPAVPAHLLIAAQIGIGASLGLRFRYGRMRRLPRTVLGGIVSGILLVGFSFFGLGYLIEHVVPLDHLSALLAAAPGGLGEMIATASALGAAAAAVAGFQLTRSMFTNIVIAPIIRYWVTRHP